MAWTSAAPGVLAALYTAVTAAASPTPVNDGPTTTASDTTEAINIGDTGDDSPAISHQYGQESMQGYSNVERFTIANLIEVAGTSGDLSAARDRAYELLGVFVGAVEADPTLGDTVMKATAAAAEYTPLLDPDQGTSARIAVTVQVEAWRLP